MARRKYPNYLTKEEVKRFLYAVDNERDLLIIRLMLECGLRVSEVVGNDRLNIPGLRPIDIDRENCALKIHGKGSKERYVPIKQSLLRDLLNYIDRNGIKPTERIFKITTRRVEQIVQKYAEKAGIVKRVHPHAFRHTFAVLSLANGMPINALQQILGHANVSTTQVYSEIVMREVRQFYNAYAPSFDEDIPKKSIKRSKK